MVSVMLIRNTCDDTIRGVVALASKIATLELKLDLSKLETSRAYIAVESRFNTLRIKVDLREPTDNLYTEFTVKGCESYLVDLITKTRFRRPC